MECELPEYCRETLFPEFSPTRLYGAREARRENVGTRLTVGVSLRATCSLNEEVPRLCHILTSLFLITTNWYTRSTAKTIIF